MPRTSSCMPLPVLGAVCLAALILPLSFSAGAMATPAIGRDLGGSAGALTWITNAFMLTFGSLLMAAGALADRFGRRRVFLSGVGIFLIVSLALTIAPSVLAIDLLRAAQGVGAAAALSGGTAALAQEFNGSARTRAFSLLGTTFGVGLAFGPILAGALIQAFGWRAVFLATAIVAGLALAFAGPRMRETRAPDAGGLDWPGAATFTAALSFFTFGVIQAPASGWGSSVVLGALAIAALALAAFIRIETRTARPMLDLSLFRYLRFVGVQVLPIATCYSFVVLLVLLPLRFIGIEGRGETATGLLMLALSAPMLVVPSVAATLTRWFSGGVISGMGLLAAGFGLIWLSRIAPGSGVSPAPAMLLIGCGTGLPWGLMDGLSISVVPTERAGMATGIFGTTRVAGEGIALAVVAALLAGLIRTDLPDAAAAQRLATGDLAHAKALLPGLSHGTLVQYYADAFATLLVVLAAITVAAALATFAFLGRKAETPALTPAKC